MSAKSGFRLLPSRDGGRKGGARREPSAPDRKAAGLGEGDKAGARGSRRSSPSRTTTRSGSRAASFSARRAASGEGPRRGGEEAGGVVGDSCPGRDVHRQRQKHRAARRSARKPEGAPSAGPTSSPRRNSFAHLVTGSARATRSPESQGSVMRCRVSCWPAVTTSGVSLAFEATSTPMALPRPPIACRLTKAARPVASAQPSAMPTAVASWRPST